VLFFELFPAFVAILSVVAFVVLFVADRRARGTDSTGWSEHRRPKAED
jgi:hypothetical protein